MTEAFDEAAGAPSDAALIAAVRAGDAAAYGALYERHLGAARRAATSLAPTRAEREDLVAEAFTRVLRVIRNGRGPTEEFRPYLLVTMRNAAINAHRGGVDVALYGEVPEDRRALDHDEQVSSRLHAEVAADAFASLPERWRTVLWHTEVEGESPAEVAPLLGLTPNSVAALAYRAREGLRQAYLQQYLPTVDRRGCRSVATELAGWVRRGIATPKRRRITAHLDGCAECRRLADQLLKINNELRVIIGPVVLGAPLALSYLTASAGSAATSGTVLATTVAQTGASTVGYLSTVKTVVAGAALATAAAVTTVMPPPVSVPDRPPAVAAPGTERARPVNPPAQSTPDSSDPGGSTGQPTPGTAEPALPGAAAPDTSTAPESATSAAPPETEPTEPEPAEPASTPAKNAEAKAAKEAEKAAEKAVKAEEKAAKQAAKDKGPEEPKEQQAN